MQYRNLEHVYFHQFELILTIREACGGQQVSFYGFRTLNHYFCAMGLLYNPFPTRNQYI